MANIFEPRFLPASLYIEAILRGTTIARRREALELIKDGSTSGDAYSATLERIKAQDENEATLAIAALTWICHSERPLQTDELCHALVVEIGATDFDLENVPLIGTLLDCCQGLVTVDAEASTVRLIHYTAQEYLCSYPGLFSKPHSVLAEKCLTYLNLQPFKNHGSYSLLPLQSMPFLKYSARYWGTHMSKDISDRSRTLALRLLSRFKDHISAVSLLEQVLAPRFRRAIDTSPRFSGLHCASFFGIVELVISLIEIEGCEVNQRDCVGRIPLAWAARNGHEGVVKTLLEGKNVDPNCRDVYGRTSLANAALHGHEGVVKLLLEREDVDPNRGNKCGATPLRCAAGKGHEGVVRLLLERENVDPNLPDNAGDGPLGRAAWKGHEGVVKLLLEWENVDPNRRNKKGATPLRSATANGHEGVVNLLLQREDVYPNRTNKRRGTPLSYAATKRHGSIVQLLQARKSPEPPVQFSQRSRAPTGPCVGTAKSHGRDGTTQGSSSKSINSQDYPHYEGRRTSQLEKTLGGGRREKAGGDGKQRKTAEKKAEEKVGDDRRQRGTAGDDRKQRRAAVKKAVKKAGGDRRRRGKAGDDGKQRGTAEEEAEKKVGGDRRQRGTAGDDRKRRKTAENGRRRRKTAEDDRRWRGKTEDDGGRRRTPGDGGGRPGMTKHRPSWLFTLICGANSEYYETD